MVEMENTHRFPPTRAVAEQWVERTPSSFKFLIPAWSLLTGKATFPPSLYEDLWKEIREDCKDKRRLYLNHLSTNAIDECWLRFADSLRPLVEADKLGAVVLRFPHWLQPGVSSTQMLEDARSRLDGLPVAVEVSHPEWFTPSNCEETFERLEDLDFTFVCLDAPRDHPRSQNNAYATTNGLGMLRLIGRQPYEERDGWTEDFRAYRYDQSELKEIESRIRHLADGCDELHVVVSTCWKDDAVVNAATISSMLGLTSQDQVIDITDQTLASESARMENA